MIKLTFGEGVVELGHSIKPGEVSSYGNLARAAGAGEQATISVSRILGRYYKKGIEMFCSTVLFIVMG